MNLSLFAMIAALVLFIVSAAGVGSPRLNLQSLGLALLTLGLMLARH